MHARIMVLVALAACKREPTDAIDVPVGATAIVAFVNPVVNEGHEGSVPDSLGDDRGGIDVAADPGTASTTDGDGIAVVETDPGSVELAVGNAALSLTVQEDGDVYDAAIAYDRDAAAFFDNTPIRYPVGERGDATYFDDGTDMADIAAAAGSDGAVIVLRPGTYTGDLTITGRDVLVFGAGFTRGAVVIDGSVDARGEAVRLRGLTLTGGLSANGNDFGASFTTVLGSASITGNAGAFLGNVFCGGGTIPSSSATLLDNWGLAPLEDVPEERCELDEE